MASSCSLILAAAYLLSRLIMHNDAEKYKKLFQREIRITHLL